MSQIIVDLLTAYFVLMFINSFLSAKNNPSKHINMYDYVACKPMRREVSICEHKTKNRSPKPTKKSKPVKQKPKQETVNQDLYNDCDLAMKSLKVDAKQRKYLLNKEFSSNKHPSNVQEFLTRVFQK